VLTSIGELLQLLAVYHKTHLYYEPYFDAGPGDKVTFEAFGVQIGLFICFDIMFQTPALDLVEVCMRFGPCVPCVEYAHYGSVTLMFGMWWGWLCRVECGCSPIPPTGSTSLR